jgi:hypothetical protein
MRDFDQLLNGVLAEYSGQEPLLGLEARVLRRVAAQKPARRWWWMLAPAVGFAAVGVVSLLPPPIIDVPRPHGHGSETLPAAAFMMGARPAVRPAIHGWPKAIAEQRVFINFARQHPELAAQMTPHLPGELVVEPLNIEPLRITELEPIGDL